MPAVIGAGLHHGPAYPRPCRESALVDNRSALPMIPEAMRGSAMAVHSVAILGAGHGGCAAAADLGKRGYCVRLHARNPERLAPLRAQGGIEARGIVQGLVPIDLLTSDVAEAVRGADLIMLVVPSLAHAHSS